MNTTVNKHSLLSFVIRSGWVIGGNTVCRAPEFLQCLRRLELMTRVLEAEYRLELPRQSMKDVSEVKRFCDGMLDGSCHPWRQSLRDAHSCLRTRSAVAASVFLFRKVVPLESLSDRAVKEKKKQYIRKMTHYQAPPPADFLSFIRRETFNMFRPGWDRDWYREVDSFCLPVSSCLENRAGAGGARAMHSREEDSVDLRGPYLDFVSDNESYQGTKIPVETRVAVIETSGKYRTVTLFGAQRSFLTPLHKIIYGYISRFPWLLRGEACKERFSDFCRKDGEVFTSGDYKDASDNLNIWCSEAAIDAMRVNSHFVPSHVWDEARRSLRSNIEGQWQQRGQLMGSLLCFPLLCILNYLTFKFAVPRRVPVKVNGDDIVFRSTLPEYQSWKERVGSSGLVLSVGKTLVTRSLFSLNSNFFLSRAKVEQVPHIRSSCIWKPAEDIGCVPGRIQRAIVGFGKEQTLRIHAEVLRSCSKMIWTSQRSVFRGLGVDVHSSAIKAAGLMEREAFYSRVVDRYDLWSPVERDVPPSYKRWLNWGMPKGWRNERSDECGDDVGASYHLVESTWDSPESVSPRRDEYMLKAREGTLRFVPLSFKFYKLAHGKLQSKGEFDRIRYSCAPGFFRKRSVAQFRVWRKVVTKTVSSSQELL